jgi:NADPH:quinone reductase-like Zn-dependent oxidoreductase
VRAIVQERYGSADVLQIREIAEPAVGDDQVLVRVRAASVHIGDWHVMTGQPYLMRVLGFGFRGPKARVRGMDAAGTVEAVGKNVTRFRAGDEVFGTCDGAFAEHAVAREATLAPKPANLTFEQAAAVPTSACVALRALRAGGITPGQKVLVVGASGGVGLFAVQIARALGAAVTAVSSAAKAELVRSVGADRVVDYAREEYAGGEQRYDLILDMAGTRSLSQLRRALTPRGTLVPVGGEGGGRLFGAVGRTVQALALSPFVSQTLRPIVAVANADDLRFLAELIEAGKVRPVVDRTYPHDRAPDAIRRLRDGDARGKLVIAV